MESTTRPRSSEITEAIGHLRLPSPVRRLEGPYLRHSASLWVKDDSRIHAIYGGNKSRKLIHILARAKARGRTCVVTFGAAGSHHVLATALFCRACGLAARAILVPQPWSSHAESVLQASINTGADLVPAGLTLPAVATVARGLTSNCQVIPPGGSDVDGCLGYFDAAQELGVQVRSGEVPEPDVIVVPFGSAGTAAGLWAGLEHARLRSRILAVSVLRGAGRYSYARWLARKVLKLVGSSAELHRERVIVDDRWVGAGYGLVSDAAHTAIELGRSLDLPLDPTYTAKAFAGALALVIAERVGSIAADARLGDSPTIRNVLYWHTLGVLSLRQELGNDRPIPRKLALLLHRNHVQDSV